ncbi:hypothetical protein [Streptomyces sp900116325]|uniref:hypothetical protein n=1 Tax=Streptomyces sp. 900116325 TaxID=3154295 RepID=UPI0033329C0B
MTFSPRTWLVGETVTAALLNAEIRDQLNSMFSAWTPYTPAWTAATTNPVLGNGSLTGQYIKIGRTCTATVILTMGSTTTYGSGNYSFSLPFQAAAATVSYLGTARLGAARIWLGHVVVSSGGTVVTVTFDTSPTDTRGTNWTGAIPEALAATHTFRFSLTYQTAT